MMSDLSQQKYLVNFDRCLHEAVMGSMFIYPQVNKFVDDNV